MSKSLIQYHGQCFWASDSVIQVWLAILVREIEAMEQPPDWLEELRDCWEFQAFGLSGGNLSLELDRYVTEETRPTIIRLCQDALHWLEEQGQFLGTLDKRKLNEWGLQGEFIQDPPVEPFRRFGEALLRLLQGDATGFGDTPATAPMV